TNEQAALRMRIDKDRASVRTQVRGVVLVTVVCMVGLAVSDRGLLDAYDTAEGQVVLAVIGSCFLAGFALLARLARPQRLEGFVLAEDLEALGAAGSDDTTSAVRLVGPHDPYLQLRDRDLLVTDEARRKYLWPALGRPGAMVADGEIVGTWRPRASGRKLRVRIEPWSPLEARRRAEVEEQAERLAACRGVILAGIAEE
ncbi:MAG: winged helix DNA-binding domain-containing protein, partial [Actinobacteria bacterium]|nr:winged helix DNA-binding domain-containing protein [Actinomycetota bacterium]